MRQKRTPKEIQAWLAKLGLDPNPIESINHRANGDTEIWLIGLSEPLLYPAPRKRTKAKPSP